MGASKKGPTVVSSKSVIDVSYEDTTKFKRSCYICKMKRSLEETLCQMMIERNMPKCEKDKRRGHLVVTSSNLERLRI
jgi:predicted RNA-binding protein YlxR (DUF448 family)